MKQIIATLQALFLSLKTFVNRSIPYWMGIPVLVMQLICLGLMCWVLSTAIRENVLEYRLEMFRGLGLVWLIVAWAPKKPA